MSDHKKKSQPLTPEQEAVKAQFISPNGGSIFMTGAGGTGKSFLCCFIRDACRSYPGFAICASTGIAAELVGGFTFHRTFYLPLNAVELGPVKLADALKKNSNAVARYRSLSMVIIEEVSMISGPLFDVWYKAADIIREGTMHKVRILASGDFLQLGPVKAPPLFTSTEWKRLFLPKDLGGRGAVYTELTLCQRQTQPLFIRSLLCMRIGQTMCEAEGIDTKCVTDLIEESKKRYETRMKDDDDAHPALVSAVLESVAGMIQVGSWCEEKERALDRLVQVNRESAIHLYPHCKSVEAENDERLRQLPTPEVTLKANDSSIKGRGARGWEELFRSFKAREVLKLKVGARVYLLVNKWQEQYGLCHGSLGVVVGFEYNGRCVGCAPAAGLKEGETLSPIVKFLTGGVRLVVPRVEFKYAPGAVTIASRIQTPLALAWSSTIHSAQGATFDAAVLHLDGIFAPGQAYVAFSRVRSMQGVFLHCKQSFKIEAEPEALLFCKERGLLDKTIAYLKGAGSGGDGGGGGGGGGGASSSEALLLQRMRALDPYYKNLQWSLCGRCGSQPLWAQQGCKACYTLNEAQLEKMLGKQEKKTGRDHVPSLLVASASAAAAAVPARKEGLTVEQRRRMEENRQRALERRTLTLVKAQAEETKRRIERSAGMQKSQAALRALTDSAAARGQVRPPMTSEQLNSSFLPWQIATNAMASSAAAASAAAMAPFDRPPPVLARANVAPIATAVAAAAPKIDNDGDVVMSAAEKSALDDAFALMNS